MARSKVLWVGEIPSVSVVAEFRNRDLGVTPVTQEAEVTPLVLSGCCCIVYNFSQLSLAKSREIFSVSCGAAVSHGLLIYLLADNDGIQDHISKVVADMHLPDRVLVRLRRRTAPIPVFEIAELAARHDPGPPYSEGLKISYEDETRPLTPEGVTLLKRAFFDCASVSLLNLSGGYSANVFRANATFIDSVVGPRPLPFFAKLDEVAKIEQEKSNYEVYASHFIPFNLRPNLDSSRCLSGAQMGLLVGNFVDHSEPLWDLIMRGQAQVALNSLFDDALRAWRLQAYCSEHTVVDGPIAMGLKSEFDYRKVRPEYVARAKAEFDITSDPIALWEQLLSLRDQRYRTGPMHGDMHGNNVRVRAGDAIVIDFYSAKIGPIVADMANLETWVSFSTPPDCTDERANTPWKDTVDRLYSPLGVFEVPPPVADGSSLMWLWDFVRQLRSMACAARTCATEYESAVAVYMLRRALFPSANPCDQFRRTYAYVCAARLIGHLITRDPK